MTNDELFELLKTELYTAANKYATLLNHTILFSSENFKNQTNYIIKFYPTNFLHLTGLKTKLNPKLFFEKCLKNNLNQIDLNNFSKNNYRRLIKGKLYALNQIDLYFYQELNVQEDFERNTVICSIATSDGIKTIGFAKANKVCVPKTILNKNKLDPLKCIYKVTPIIKNN